MFYIYRTTNLINGKTYIGQHKYKKLNDRYIGSGKLLKKAFKKYDKENFKKDIIEFNIPTLELANDWEQMYILFEKAKGKGEYNIAKGGRGRGSVSEETRRKLSEACKGEKNGFYGKKHSDKVKKEIGEKNKGEKNGMYGIPSPNRGKPAWNKDKTNIYSQEALKKMSEKATERNKGRRWYNNGKVNKFCKECPPDYATGRLRKG